MISIHLSVNNKPAMIDESNIMFAEECDGQDKDKNKLAFTRIYLKQPLPLPDGNISSEIDVCETIKSLIAKIRPASTKS